MAPSRICWGLKRTSRRWVKLSAEECRWPELADAGIAAQVNAIGSLATIFFTAGPVRNYTDAKRSDTKRCARFFREMLDRGIFLAPSQFEATFISAAHTSADIDRTLAAAHESLQAISADSAV